MRREFGITHHILLDLMKDGKVHTRYEIEKFVFAAHRDSNKQPVTPSGWRSGITKSLLYFVRVGYFHTRYDGKGQEIFVIDNVKRKFYLNFLKSRERDKKLGLIDASGAYVNRGLLKSRSQSFTTTNGKVVSAPWVKFGKKNGKNGKAPGS